MRKPVLLDGVISSVAELNLNFGLNPDLEELKRYNVQAKQDACPHSETCTIEYDDGRCGIFCDGCRKWL